MLSTLRSALAEATASTAAAEVGSGPPHTLKAVTETGIVLGEEMREEVLERLRRLGGRIEECGQAALLPSTLVRAAAVSCAPCFHCRLLRANATRAD